MSEHLPTVAENAAFKAAVEKACAGRLTQRNTEKWKAYLPTLTSNGQSNASYEIVNDLEAAEAAAARERERADRLLQSWGEVNAANDKHLRERNAAEERAEKLLKQAAEWEGLALERFVRIEAMEGCLREARDALKALLVMMDRGDKPRKLDETLTWVQNDLKARTMAAAALARLPPIL